MIIFLFKYTKKTIKFLQFINNFNNNSLLFEFELIFNF